jgi:NADPH-dependent curcumin reductase CurA
MNRRIVLASRPNGLPGLEHFRLEESAIPVPQSGQVLLQTMYLSLDPYMRELMNETGPVYAPSVGVGETMVGGTVSRVVGSENPQFAVGDVVLSRAGWQDYALSDGSDLMLVDDGIEPSHTLGGLGMTGFTAYVGLLDIGRPGNGETVVVSAAAGAVGSMVGQIARIKSARVVGIAGGADKCRHVVEKFGFDACIDRHDPRFAARLAAACPSGIDVYFENVGGAVFDAVLPLLNIGARVPVCGNIAHYNGTAGNPGPDRLPLVISTILQKRLCFQGLVILDHYEARFQAFQRDAKEWVDQGLLSLQEERTQGLESAPAAFINLLTGRSLGKVVVQINAR